MLHKDLASRDEKEDEGTIGHKIMNMEYSSAQDTPVYAVLKNLCDSSGVIFEKAVLRNGLG